MPRLPSHCGGTGCCCRKYSSSSVLSALPLDRQNRVHVVALLHCFISTFSLFLRALAFPLKLSRYCCQIYSPALPSVVSPVSAEDYVAIGDVFILSSISSCYYLFIFPFLFFSSLRSERAAGRWRDEEEELKEGLEEVVESAGQVCRVLLELELVCQGHWTSIYPSIHLPVCLCCPSICPSSHLPSSQEKCPTYTSLVIQNLLASTLFVPLFREKTSEGKRGPRNDRI